MITHVRGRIVAEKNPKKAWKATNQTHLAQAVEGWSNITQAVQVEKPVPPDQKILNDIKGLLTELKFKLDELSSPPTSTSQKPIDGSIKPLLETTEGSTY